MLEQFELLSSDPIVINEIGSIVPPTLAKIKLIGYKQYERLVGFLGLDFNSYLEFTKLKDKYDALDEESKNTLTYFNLMTCDDDFRNIYIEIFNFFMFENVIFDPIDNVFLLWKYTSDYNNKRVGKFVGYVNNDNFEFLRKCLLQVNHIQEEVEEVEEEPKYKNDFARKLTERMEKANKEKRKIDKDPLCLGKKISKYCAFNLHGINMLNVYNMTIYQFYDQWTELNLKHQSDLQDDIYVNSVSLKDSSSYDSQLWLK